METVDGHVEDVVRWSKREGQYRTLEYGENVEQLKPRAWGARHGLTEYVIEQKNPVLIVENFKREAQALGLEVWPTFGRYGRPTHSWLGVPMMVGDRVIGIISIQSLEKPRAFDQAHGRILLAVASKAAQVIENARLYKETRRLYQEARGEVIAAKQLATLGTAMAALRHRINNTFNVIVPNVTRLKKRVDASDATIAEILDIIERNARYTSDIIARIQEPLRETEVQDVNVNAVLDEAIAWAQEKWSAEKLPCPSRSNLSWPTPFRRFKHQSDN